MTEKAHKTRSVLLTGGAGYIGSVVAQMLIDQGIPVVVIDDLRDGKREAVAKQAVFVEAGIGDASVFEQIFQEHHISTVMHFAASANVPDSVINPALYYQNNVANTLILLDCMKQAGVRRLVFSSTAAVYGEPLYAPIDEEHPLKAMTPYGRSKLMCEQIIEDFSKAYGLDYIIFRYFCAAGATPEHGESRQHETHLTPVLLDALLGKRDKLFIFGDDFPTEDGTGMRDYIHVSDIASAHLLALDAQGPGQNQIYNLGLNKSYTVRQIIELTEKMYGVSIPKETKPRRPGDPAVLTTTSAKANRLLGWTPVCTIEDIITSAYEWRRNPRY